MDLYILKIGGSSVTFKESNELKAKLDVIRGITKEIKRARTKKPFKLVVVHGAGPFGHKLVTDYGIKNGVRSDRDVEGFVRTHNSMEDLNKVFMDTFREEGLLGFPVQPSAFIIQNDKKISRFDTTIIEKLLERGNGVIPILYGDMVIDESLGASVISGDSIVPYLAKKLSAKRVLLGTDVDGIFTADPKLNPDAKIIPKIGKGNLEMVMRSIGESASVDVTSGMKGKVMEIINSLSGTKVMIYSIFKKDNTYKALIGERIPCTEISM